MKYVVMVGDGMADEWQDGSDEKTPLMAARTPVLDFLAERSELGLARTVPGRDGAWKRRGQHVHSGI